MNQKHTMNRGLSTSASNNLLRGARPLVLLSSLALASLACGGSSGLQDTSTTLQASVVAGDFLGSAADYRVLGASTVTNTGPTVIDGNLGLSPGNAVTGFPPGLVIGATNIADGAATQAQSDLGQAITALQNQPCEHTLDNAELAGLTLTPGVYCFTSPSVGLSGALTLDAQGDDAAQFVFLIESTLTSANDSSVALTNGGSACNILWQVGSSATLGTGTRFLGSVLASVSITATTGATVTGRLLANTGAVTLDTNTITDCDALAVEPVGGGEGSPVSGEGEGEGEQSDEDGQEYADLNEVDESGNPCP